MPDLIVSTCPEGESREQKAELLKTLAQLSDFSILLLDLEGKIQTWNSGTQSIWGYSRQEIMNVHFSLLYKDCLSSKIYLSEVVAKGSFEFEGWAQPKGRQPFYAKTVLTPYFSHDKILQGFAHSTRDITDKKNLEEENRLWHEKLEEKVGQRTAELASANKELEAFSYSVSHDLRTPLRAISGYSMMLQEDYADKLDTEAARIINAIIGNAGKMGDLIDDLLSFSRMGRLTVIHSQVSMRRLVDESLVELMPADHSYSLDIRTLPACIGDPNMLRQVWVNLISNALKYSSLTEAPAIEIGSNDDGDFQTYYVKDNGAGFEMKYAGKLFGVFQRLHRADEFEGTGVGLALAKRIINKHGGEIWGEGQLQKGSTFSFSIPK
ncbi:MAG TPA: ATP-binding protein [Flavisolibacter sp.]